MYDDFDGGNDERYEDDLNEWETEQVFQDREHEQDDLTPDTDLPEFETYFPEPDDDCPCVAVGDRICPKHDPNYHIEG